MSVEAFKDKFKRGHQRFSDGTSMHGFTELYYAKTIIWKVIWFLLVFGAICVTIYQVCGAVHSFIHQTSSTLIQPATDEELTYPPLKFCITHWLNWIDWNKITEMGFTKETVLIGMSYLTNIYSSDYFNVSELMRNFTDLLKQNNFTNLTTFYKAIATDNPTSNDIFNEIEFVVTDSNNPYFCYTSSGNRIKEHMIKIENGFHSTGTQKNTLSFGWLNLETPEVITAEEYGSYMAEWIFVKTPQYYLYEQNEIHDQDYSNVHNNYSTVILPNILYIDGYSNINLKLLSEVDEYFITIKASARRSKNTAKSKCKVGVKFVLSDTSCTDFCSELAVERCWSRSNNLVNFITATKDGKSTEPNKLNRNKIMFLNESELTTTVTTAATTTVSSLNSTVETYQSTVNYVQSDSFTCNDTMLEAAYNACIAVNCTEGCEKWSFDFTVTTRTLHEIVKNVAYKRYTSCFIHYPSNEDVLISTETDSKTWEDFVGNVGGLLGIWTGASILSFFQLFYLCCFADMQGLSLARWWKRKRSHEITNTTSEFPLSTTYRSMPKKYRNLAVVNKKKPLKRIKTIIIKPYNVVSSKDNIFGNYEIRQRNGSIKPEQ